MRQKGKVRGEEILATIYQIRQTKIPSFRLTVSVGGKLTYFDVYLGRCFVFKNMKFQEAIGKNNNLYLLTHDCKPRITHPHVQKCYC